MWGCWELKGKFPFYSEEMRSLKDILAWLDPRHRSDEFRRSLRNSSWSLVDYLFHPILLVLVTPFLVFRLGVERFGIWMLVSAVTGAMGIFSLGLGDATIKYVSSHNARKDVGSVIRVVRCTLALYSLLGLAAASVTFLLASFLVKHVFKVGLANQELAVLAMRVGGVGLAARFLDSVFLSALRGLERHDLSARVTIAVKFLTTAATVAVVALGYGVVGILWATALLTGLSAWAQARIVKDLVPAITFWPALDRCSLSEIFGFGIYSWFQGMAGVLVGQADRLLIGALLGTSPLTYYSVCQRVAMQVYAVLSSAMGFLFPHSSAAMEQGDMARLRSTYFRALSAVQVSATAMALPLILFARPILSMWMGADFSRHAAPILQVLAFAYALIATSIVPYYFLNGTGHVRLNSLFSGISAGVVAGTSALLIPYLAGVGAALGKASSALTTSLVSRTYLHWKILCDRRWYAGAIVLAPVAFPLALGFIWVHGGGPPQTGPIGVLFGIILSSLAGGLLAGVLIYFTTPPSLFQSPSLNANL